MQDHAQGGTRAQVSWPVLWGGTGFAKAVGQGTAVPGQCEGRRVIVLGASADGRGDKTGRI